MKIFILITLGVLAGWFTHESLCCAVEQIYSWKPPALRAALAIVCIIAILVIYK